MARDLPYVKSLLAMYDKLEGTSPELHAELIEVATGAQCPWANDAAILATAQKWLAQADGPVHERMAEAIRAVPAPEPAAVVTFETVLRQLEKAPPEAWPNLLQAAGPLQDEEVQQVVAAFGQLVRQSRRADELPPIQRAVAKHLGPAADAQTKTQLRQRLEENVAKAKDAEARILALAHVAAFVPKDASVAVQLAEARAQAERRKWRVAGVVGVAIVLVLVLLGGLGRAETRRAAQALAVKQAAERQRFDDAQRARAQAAEQEERRQEAARHTAAAARQDEARKAEAQRAQEKAQQEEAKQVWDARQRHLQVANDGLTVQRTDTRVTWQRNPPSDERTWKAAQQYCASLSLAGGHWRLPNDDELHDILSSDVSPPPLIDPYAFPNTPPTWFCTAWNGKPAIAINFANGFGEESAGSHLCHVRCARKDN